MIAIYIITSLIVMFVMGSLIYATYLFRRAKQLAPYYTQKEMLVQEIQTAQQVLSQVRQERDNMQAGIAQAKLDIAEGQANRKWLQDNQDTVASLKIQIDKAKQILEDVNQRLNTRKGEVQEADGELRNRLAELNATNRVKENAQRDLTHIQTDLNEEKRRYKTLEASNAKLEEKQNDLMPHILIILNRKCLINTISSLDLSVLAGIFRWFFNRALMLLAFYFKLNNIMNVIGMMQKSNQVKCSPIFLVLPLQRIIKRAREDTNTK